MEAQHRLFDKLTQESPKEDIKPQKKPILDRLKPIVEGSIDVCY